MAIINAGGRQIKSRQLQEKDFKDFISHIAEKDCKVCSGRGWRLWDEFQQSLIPCDCVMINAHIEKVKKAKETDKKQIQEIEVIRS